MYSHLWFHFFVTPITSLTICLQLQHVLLETEAQNVRSSIMTAFQHIKTFAEEVQESGRKLGNAIQQIESGSQMINEADGTQRVVQVKLHYIRVF